MAQPENNFKNGAQATAWSGDEFDRVPLKQRLKLLWANYRISGSGLKSKSHIPSIPPSSGVAVADIRENGDCFSQFGCSAEEHMAEMVEERHAGELGESDNQENLANKCVSSTHTVTTDSGAITEKVTSVKNSSLQESLSIQKNLVRVKVEYADNYVENSSASCMRGSSLDGVQASVNFDPGMSIESIDELEHLVLKERLRRLLPSKCLGLTSKTLEENSAETVTGQKQFLDQRHLVSGNQTHEIKALPSDKSKGTLKSSSKPHQALDHCPPRNKSNYADSLGIQRNYTLCSSEKECVLKYGSIGEKTSDSKTVQGSSVFSLSNVKTEPPGYNEFQGTNVAAPSQMSFGELKSKVEIVDDAYEDELDHMLLRERMKLLSRRDYPSLDIHQTSKCMSKTVHSTFGCRPVASTPSESFKVNRPRKRRKTVTDSIETAMEEDAPGLLKVLVDKGVPVDEIKLYGERESEDALDDSSTTDTFTELEEIISKLFSQRDSFLKLGPLRCTKGEKAEKASYWLECLLSLVEQARYLRFRNWPVEWGWCRDLQSFIFVFERHNRIVLERPEYGYATYFFELANYLPINWQIKRLVTAMKLTSCSRNTIIENKPLMVGDDLSEGEARVLMEYGWIPNTGIGTMLNYSYRVVHDRWNEKDRSEWRSKIAKLLMDGYNGGMVISTGTPRKLVVESDVAHPVEIKLEHIYLKG